MGHDMAKVNHDVVSTLEQGSPFPGVAGSHAAEVFSRIPELPVDRQAELSEIIENMLDEEEDRRDIKARRKLVQRARALQDAEL
jgi:hypothetical protein